MCSVNFVALDRAAIELRSPRTAAFARRIIKRLPRAIDRRNAQSAAARFRRPRRRRDLAADFLAELGVFVGRRPHQRDRRVVDVKLAAFELRGNRLARPEIDHVDAPPTETTCGTPRRAAAVSRSGPA